MISEPYAGDAVERYGPFIRGGCAVIAGMVAGVVLISAIEQGLSHAYGDREATSWGAAVWGEHWILRVVASCVATVGAGFLAGVVARRHSFAVGVLTALPSVALWAFSATLALGGRIPFTTLGALEPQISLGNRVAMFVLVATTVPLSVWSARGGTHVGAELASHFDSRRFSFLGVRWFHWLWLLFFVNVILVEVTVATLNAFGWVLTAWGAGFRVLSFAAPILSSIVFATMFLMASAVLRTYGILAGLEQVPTGKARALAILKHGFGRLLLAVGIQGGIWAMHYGLSWMMR